MIGGTIWLGENIYWWEGGGHRAYFVDGGIIGVGTPHNIQRKNLSGRVGGWVDDFFRKYSHFMAPSCKLELARFSALLRIQNGAECGKNWVQKIFWSKEV